MADVELLIVEVLACHPRPDQAGALCVLGEDLSMSGDAIGALACFDRALRIDVRSAPAWCGRAEVLVQLGRQGEAVGCLGRALEAKPGFARAYLVKGDLLRKLGIRDEALECYEKAVEAMPDLAGAWFSRAALLYELERRQEARLAIARFVAIAPPDHPELIGARMMQAELGADTSPPARPKKIRPFW